MEFVYDQFEKDKEEMYIAFDEEKAGL